MEAHSDTITWGTVTISYQYSFSRRRTLAITVHPDLSVTVKAPSGTDPGTISQFVRKRASWIEKTRRNFEQYLPKQPPRRYIGGETHRYLGRQYRLRVERAEEDSVRCLRGYLTVATRTEPGSERVKELLESWYRAHARRVFGEQLAACHKRIAKYGVPLPTLTIKRMARRWGSFSSARRITLNLLLILVPKECIDYVIFHELCHFKVKHHGPRFWRLMEAILPDYEDRRRKLNRYAE